jgi:predicted aldo/keto reductase-like oxidoreductase
MHQKLAGLRSQCCEGNRSHADGLTRREFLGLTLTAALLPAVSQSAEAHSAKGTVPCRRLGRTGETVSIIGIGGAHLGYPDEQTAIRIVRTAVDNGVNFMDNSWDYNGGASEERMGKALREGYRNRVFLMTKIDGRDAKTALKQLDESLRRLETDHLDLLQFHEIIRMNDAERIFAPGGTLEVTLQAQKAGKLRYIGFTGHKNPKVHLHMLDVAARHKFTFDTVQMPLNVMDAHFESFEKLVLPELVRNNIGVLGMKPMGSSIILRSKAVTPVECLHYAMNLPTSVVITGCDSMQILEQALAAARSFKPMPAQEVAALLRKTSLAAQNGEYERYKTSHDFDSTHAHPEWLGPGGEQEA